MTKAALSILAVLFVPLTTLAQSNTPPAVAPVTVYLATLEYDEEIYPLKALWPAMALGHYLGYEKDLEVYEGLSPEQKAHYKPTSPSPMIEAVRKNTSVTFLRDVPSKIPLPLRWSRGVKRAPTLVAWVTVTTPDIESAGLEGGGSVPLQQVTLPLLEVVGWDPDAKVSYQKKETTLANAVATHLTRMSTATDPLSVEPFEYTVPAKK